MIFFLRLPAFVTSGVCDCGVVDDSGGEEVGEVDCIEG